MKKLMNIMTLILALAFLVGCAGKTIDRKGSIVIKDQPIYQMEAKDTFGFSAEETHLRLLTAVVFEGTQRYRWLTGIHEWLWTTRGTIESRKHFVLGSRMIFLYTGPGGISVGFLAGYTPDYIMVEFEELGPQKTFVTVRTHKPMATDPVGIEKELNEVKQAIYLAILATTPKTYEECMEKFEEVMSAAELEDEESQKKFEEASEH